MKVFYVDTSALAKRYLDEAGSSWVLTWAEPPAGNLIIISDMTPVEMYSLLARRVREGILLSENAAGLRTDVLVHIEQEYLVVPIDIDVLTLARDLVTRYPLRTLDAVQLASALHASEVLQVALTFVAADNNLLEAATAAGFETDNPLLHP